MFYNTKLTSSYSDNMKFTGSDFALLFFTSADLTPSDFLSENAFVLKLSAIFAPWDEAVSAVEILSTEEFAKLCENVEMCNVVLNNLKG